MLRTAPPTCLVSELVISQPTRTVKHDRGEAALTG